MRVLITDGNERAALAATRALGRRQIQVIVGAERSMSLAASSKYCSSSFSYPSPYVNPTGFVSRILDIVKRDCVTALFPMSDIAMQVLGPEKEEFEKYTKVPVPCWNMFEAISDKWNLMRLALSLQVPIPETIFVSDGRIEEVLGCVSSFPVVVKPGRSLIQRNGAWHKTGVYYANNAEELRQLYREIDYLRQPSLIQRRIVGNGQGLFALMNKGEPLALFAHKRLREKPPSGGVSVLRESIGLPKPMVDYALRLLQHVGWHGVAMVEFKIDRDGGVPLLMEANGRFWGSLQLAIDAGVDFPYLLYRLAIGQPIQVPKNGYRTGVKSRWLLGDLDHLLLRLFKPEKGLHLPRGAPSKGRTLLNFCRFFQRRTFYEVEHFNDPGPCMYELRNYLKPLLRGLWNFVRVWYTRSIMSGSYYRSVGRQKLPPHIRNILIVCKGNVCRSPLAETYLRYLLQKQGHNILVKSAGLETSLGKPAHPLARFVGQQEGFSLEAHTTQLLLKGHVDKADLILVMELAHCYRLLDFYPEVLGKVFLLGQFSNSSSYEIADPYDGTLQDFQHCFKLIRESCDGLIQCFVPSLRKQNEPSADLV